MPEAQPLSSSSDEAYRIVNIDNSNAELSGEDEAMIATIRLNIGKPMADMYAGFLRHESFRRLSLPERMQRALTALYLQVQPVSAELRGREYDSTVEW